MDIFDKGETELRRYRMREFYQLTHILFTKPERLILYKLLKDYRRRRDVDRLVHGLKLVLRTYTKLELLKYVRYFIWEGHLAEFDRMTNFHTLFRPRRKDRRLHHSLEHLSVAGSATPSSSSRHYRDVRVFTLRKEPGEQSLGFSVRGGSEHGLGIFISEIDEESVAEKSGLKVGDKILEVNNISLKNVASSSAVKVLTGSSRLKLVIQRTKKVPEWRLSREKTSWYDVQAQHLIKGEFEECGISHHIRGLDVDVPERRVNLKFARTDKTLGFNIRGGREYGLGIYVSKMDREGLADENGVRVGDQIIDVNGIPFDNITHANAVEVLKGKKHLILTLRDVGRFPVFKELYAEYTWSDGHLRATSSVNNIHIGEPGLHGKSRSANELFSKTKRLSALQSDIFLPNERAGQSTSGSRERFNDEINSDADSDSLFNLEQWAQDIKETGDDNHGYVSDTEQENNVVVHVQNVDIEVNEYNQRSNNDIESEGSEDGLPEIYSNIKGRNTRENGDNDMDIAGDEEENDYASADMIYAKINKSENKFDTTSNFSFNSRITDDKPNTQGMPDEGDGQLYAVSNVSRSQTSSSHSIGRNYVKNKPPRKNIHLHKEAIQSSSEDRLIVSAEAEEATIENKSVDGSLYSRVRKLSVGSYSYESKPLSLPSVVDQYESASVISGVNDDEAQTLQIRKYSSHSDNSDSVTVTAIHRPYQNYNFDTNEAMDEGVDDGDSDITTLNRTRHPAGNDENFSLDDLENRLKVLEKRQTTLGVQELNTLSTEQNVSDGSPTHKKGKWKTFKNKIKGSLRIKSSKRTELSLKPEGSSQVGSVRQKGLFDRSFGRDITQSNTIDEYNMATLEDEAKKMLNNDEFDAVMRHVKMYHDSHELETFVEVLLTILDKPEKILLLRDIRGVVYPLDMVQFDNMVNHYEIEAYQKLSMKLHLPLNHKPQRRPRKNLITTEIGKHRKRKSVHFAEQDSSDSKDADGRVDKDEDPHDIDVPTNNDKAEDGHFHIKPIDQYEKQKKIVHVMHEHMMESKNRPMTSRDLQGSTQADESHVMNRFQYLDHEQENSDIGSSILAFSEFGSHSSIEMDKYPGAVIVHLSKNKQHLGLDFIEEIVNGVREVQIQRIDPKSAANDDSTLEIGMTLLAVDRHRVEGCSVEECQAILRKSYADKQFVSMKLVLHKEQSTNF